MGAPEPLTVVVQESDPGLAALLDDATEQILALEAQGEHPRRLAVSAGAYALIERTKARDLARDLPLIVLGLPLVARDRASA